MFYDPLHTENQIDGKSFLELSEPDIKEIVKPIGVVKKIMKLQNKFKAAVVSIRDFTTKLAPDEHSYYLVWTAQLKLA